MLHFDVSFDDYATAAPLLSSDMTRFPRKDFLHGAVPALTCRGQHPGTTGQVKTKQAVYRRSPAAQHSCEVTELLVLVASGSFVLTKVK